MYKNRTKKLIDTENRLVFARGRESGMGKMSETVKSINFQTQSKLVLGCNVPNGNYG